MPRSSALISNDFRGHLRSLDMTRRKMERLLVTKQIVVRDINQIYAGLYLDAIASFEKMIEDLFIGLATGRLASNSVQIVPLISFANNISVRPAIFGGRGYVDWLPYDNTESRARVFFRKGIPFTSSLDGNDKQRIRTFGYIRNAIAHRSDYSKRVFENRVLANQNLMRGEMSPAGYLRSVFRFCSSTEALRRLCQFNGSHIDQAVLISLVPF